MSSGSKRATVSVAGTPANRIPGPGYLFAKTLSQISITANVALRGNSGMGSIDGFKESLRSKKHSQKRIAVSVPLFPADVNTQSHAVFTKTLAPASTRLYSGQRPRCGYTPPIGDFANRTGRWQNGYMDGKRKLTKTTLGKSLNVVCAGFANFLEAATGKEIAVEQLAKLPDAVFEFALFAGWFPEIPIGPGYSLEEPDANHAMLGGEIVTRTFRDEFVALIQRTLEEYDPIKIEEHYRLCREEEKEEERIEGLRSAAEEYHRLAPRSSPRQVIRRWLSENSCNVAQLAGRAGMGDATVYRIMAGTFDYERYSENLKNLAAVMECDWQELLPL